MTTQGDMPDTEMINHGTVPIERGWASPHYANPYQALFTELSRRFSVPSYHALPVERYHRAMAWLNELHTALAAGAMPTLGS